MLTKKVIRLIGCLACFWTTTVFSISIVNVICVFKKSVVMVTAILVTSRCWWQTYQCRYFVDVGFDVILFDFWSPENLVPVNKAAELWLWSFNFKFFFKQKFIKRSFLTQDKIWIWRHHLEKIFVSMLKIFENLKFCTFF